MNHSVDAGNRVDLGDIGIPMDRRTRGTPRHASICSFPVPNPIPWPLTFWSARGFAGEVAIRRGDAEGGTRACGSSLQSFTQRHTNYSRPNSTSHLASGLSGIGQVDEAVALIDESLGQRRNKW